MDSHSFERVEATLDGLLARNPLKYDHASKNLKRRISTRPFHRDSKPCGIGRRRDGSLAKGRLAGLFHGQGCRRAAAGAGVEAFGTEKNPSPPDVDTHHCHGPPPSAHRLTIARAMAHGPVGGPHRRPGFFTPACRARAREWGLSVASPAVGLGYSVYAVI